MPMAQQIHKGAILNIVRQSATATQQLSDLDRYIDNLTRRTGKTWQLAEYHHIGYTRAILKANDGETRRIWWRVRVRSSGLSTHWTVS